MFDNTVFDDAQLDEVLWLDCPPESEDTGQLPASGCAPPGWLALELDQGCAAPACLSDAELIEGIIGFDDMASWAGARTIAWDDGGTTCQHNLRVGCRHGHRLKTFAPSWTIDQHLDGRITFITPTGHPYTSYSHDYRPGSRLVPPGDDPPPL